MITQRTFHSHSAELGPWTILFSTSSGCASGSTYAAPNRTSALYRVLFWMIYRRDVFVAASSISALPPPFFLCPPYPTHRERRSRSPAAFILAAQPSPRSPLLFFLFLSALLSLYIVTLYLRVTSPCHPLSSTPSARTGRLHISTFGRF